MPQAWLPPAEYIETLPRATAYACLYFTDVLGRPFQLRPVHASESWHWPGGSMDPGETPWETALRECHEETGLVHHGEPRLLGACFTTHRGEDWPANDIGFIFDGGALTDAEIASIVLDPEEHTDYQLRTLAEWQREMSPRAFERLAAIDRARRTGVTVYLDAPDED
ncbi:NUDIX domain-containing protein [Streptomyces sp. NPDC090025]|uniref:NUDIX domain-containing protein n=1 Tax=Streptomyces sp. NPDC090025 TaxID=3365922 RepID=UPI003837E0BD